MMSLKVSSFNVYEKDCVLALDEMFITEGYSYDVASKTFVGKVTLPQHSGTATHGLVFMLGGISSRWKQTVAYYFTGKYTKKKCSIFILLIYYLPVIVYYKSLGIIFVMIMVVNMI